MDHDNDRLPAIVEYLKMNPTPSSVTENGQVIHVHEHHHYPPPAPPPPPPKPTVASQVIPWVWTALAATIIGTVCSLILAAVVVALVVGLLAVAVAGAVIAYLIRTTRESQINMELARRPGRRSR